MFGGKSPLPTPKDADGNPISDAELAERWEKYMSGLKAKDPEEYEMLMKDLAEMQAQQSEGGFAPRVPGSDTRMGSAGLRPDATKVEGVDVVPTPGFVVKTRQLVDGMKVFVNVCHSEHVRQFSKKKVLADDGKEQEGVNVPLSMGPAAVDEDNSGAKCLVYDMIVNPNVVADALGDRSGNQRHFLCELAIQCAEQKFGKQLDRRYKLPRLRYKGDPVRSQRIRKSAAPVIEEVEDAAPAPPHARSAPRAAGPGATAGPGRPSVEPTRVTAAPARGAREMVAPRVAVRERRADGSWHDATDVDWATASLRALRSASCPEKAAAEEATRGAVTVGPYALPAPATHVRVDIKLPGVASLPHHKLRVGEWVVSLRADGAHPVEVFLPAPIDVDRATARFCPAAHTLRVAAPVLPPCDAAGQAAEEGADPGSREWLLAAALRDSRSDADRGAGPADGPGDAPEFAEDAKLPRLPPGVDPYTGEARDEAADTLPEDRFLQRDLMSQHLLQQKREGAARTREKQAEHDAREAAAEAEAEAEAAAAVRARQARLDAEAAADAEALRVLGAGDGASGEDLCVDGVRVRVRAGEAAGDRPAIKREVLREVDLDTRDTSAGAAAGQPASEPPQRPDEAESSTANRPSERLLAPTALEELD